MAVTHMRIDNRLIHGQVTVSWANAFKTTHMIVTNDQVARDPLQKMLLPQAARGVPTLVLSVEDTLKFAASEEGQKARILIIAKLPQDALRLLEGGLKPAEINVGNQAPTPGTKFKMVTHSIAATPEDAAIYRAIAGKGYKLTCKMMPSDRATDFLEVLKKHKL
ncbi:MAG TPA: PTS sugar transporter subunit IIB [Ktedonobacteraceae bacterium]|nr:PTS sugar transporter subunit IIB [Ktedonobacteraceae bacterium]